MPKSGDRRRWSADYDLYSVYADNERQLGDVVRTPDDGWDAFDMTRLNESRTRMFCIGHYRSRSAAKRAVEEYWADSDRYKKDAGEGRKQ